MAKWVGILKDLFHKDKDKSTLRPVKASVEHRVSSKERSVKEWIAEWESFYQDIFEIKADFSNLQIPKKESGFN